LDCAKDPTMFKIIQEQQSIVDERVSEKEGRSDCDCAAGWAGERRGRQCLMTEEVRGASRWVVDRYIKTRRRTVVDIGCALGGKNVLW